MGPELMDKFRQQSIRFGTQIITETVSKIDLSARPFRYWRESQESSEPETADTVIIATGASAKRLGLKGEESYWQSGISACAVCDGAVPIFRYFRCFVIYSFCSYFSFRNKPLAVIGGGDSAAEEATCNLVQFLDSNTLTNILVCRSYQVWLACVCSRSPRGFTRIQDHGQASPEQPQNRAWLLNKRDEQR